MTSSEPTTRTSRADEILRQSADLAAAVVDEARITLMTSLRFMDVALWRMPLATKRLKSAMATDGYLFYLDPVAVIGAYRRDSNEIVRDYLHAVLHCVFGHPFTEAPHSGPAAIPQVGARFGLASANLGENAGTVPAESPKSHSDLGNRFALPKNGVDTLPLDAGSSGLKGDFSGRSGLWGSGGWLWDVACDVAVESCALELVGLRFPSALDEQRRRVLKIIGEAVPALTARMLYASLAAALDDNDPRASELAKKGLTSRFVESLPELFARDDHSVWTRKTEQAPWQVAFDDDVVLIGVSDEHLHGEKPEELELDEQTHDPGVNMPGVAAPSSGASAAEGEVEGGDRFVDAEAYQDAEASFASMVGVKQADFTDIAWTDISKLIEIELEAFTGKPGVESGTFEVNLSVANRKVYDFRDFLKRFSALSEEMKVSTEEFDYIYYTYGLNRYGNMPLIEPLEYQESRRIREFVIAIDTSASCAGGLVKHFIEKTYDVLRSQAAFGRKVNVHIVQCDCEVRKDTKITSIRDLDDDFGEFTARGFGGTDFRPVFKYVDELVESRELANLKGMIYLTDGIGKYPEEAPGYDCAFVFINEEGARREVPPWAMKVMMTEDEILEL